MAWTTLKPLTPVSKGQKVVDPVLCLQCSSMNYPLCTLVHVNHLSYQLQAICNHLSPVCPCHLITCWWKPSLCVSDGFHFDTITLCQSGSHMPIYMPSLSCMLLKKDVLHIHGIYLHSKVAPWVQPRSLGRMVSNLARRVWKTRSLSVPLREVQSYFPG